MSPINKLLIENYTLETNLQLGKHRVKHTNKKKKMQMRLNPSSMKNQYFLHT